MCIAKCAFAVKYSDMEIKGINMNCNGQKFAAALLGLVAATSANAAVGFSGTVTWMEVWRNGNVAFRLSDSASTGTCNGQFILNASDPGTRNQYAALLAAKKTGSAVSVYSYLPCGPAENYGSSYIIVDYLYVVQD